MNLKDLLRILVLMVLALSCKSQKEKATNPKLNIPVLNYFSEMNFGVRSDTAVIEFLDTLEHIDPSIFDIYSEYLIKTLSKELQGVKAFDIYYACDKLNQNMLYKYSEQEVDLINSYSYARNELIEELLTTFDYKELGEMEMGYYQYEKYSSAYKPIEHTFLELIIKKGSECYLDENETSNFNFVMNMFNETGHKSYVERIHQIVDTYCSD